MPVLELTMEQEFRLRQIEDTLNNKDVDKEDLITVFMALQHQNFVLGNTIKNLISKWGETTRKGPIYYSRGRIPVWEFIQDQGLNFHLGNAIKYICRAGYKEDYVEDLQKAIHYLENELQHATGGGISPRIQHPVQPPATLYTEDFDR